MQDLAELSGELNTTLEVPKASIHLSKHVEGMVKKLESKLANVRSHDAILRNRLSASAAGGH